jgi:type II secretory pathway pseudopilin PulG
MFKLVNNKNGFSIIEIMVAFTILVMAFVSIIQAFPFALSIGKDSELSTTASYLAQEKLEEITSLGYSNVGTGEIETKHRLSSDLSDYKYDFQRQTNVIYIDSDLNDSVTDLGMKKVTTMVYYNSSLSNSEEIYTVTVLISEL